MITPAPRPLSLAGIWDDAGRMLRANAGVLSAVAGVFLLLPATLIARFAPQPPRTDGFELYAEALRDYFANSWAAQLAAAAASAIGVIAIYLLLIETPRLTVAAALRRALVLVPGYFAVSMIVVFAAGFGFLFLIVPGLYLLARLVCAGPVVATESPNAPLTALQRAWTLSRGRAWSILLMLAGVYLVASILSVAVQDGVGALLLLTAGRSGVVLTVLSLLQGLVSAAFGTVLTVVIAAIYRAAR